MDDQPPVETVEAPVAPPPAPPKPEPNPDIEARLAAIEMEAVKWIGGRAGVITRHVAELRKLL